MIPLEEIVSRYGERLLFLGDDVSVTYAEFVRMVSAADPGEGEILGMVLDWTPAAMARLLAAFQSGKCVIPGNEIPSGNLDPFLSARPLLVLKTGGTTGRPRHAVHSVEALLKPYRIEQRAGSRLLVLYAADHIAGLDAFWQAIHRGGTLVLPSGRDPESVARALEGHRIQVLPATPSFLNFLALSGALEGRDLSSVEVIPHGAEPMADSVRERIQSLFPNARLVQRFGMTELGALPVQPDPEDPKALFLEAPGYAWRIEEGELLIQSPSRMLGTLEEGTLSGTGDWHATGDLAEPTGRGSLRITGRREGLINVGGEKIIPEKVESLLLELPMVLEAAVEGIPNPLTGQAVSARVVFRDLPDAMGLLRAMRRLTRSRGLSLAHVPTRVEAVDSIPGTAVGKKSRHRGKA